MKKLGENKDFPEKEAVFELYKAGTWFNKKTLAKATIQKTSDAFKTNNPTSKITHILDREFDDEDYFGFIAGLGDDFVIRVKKTRNEIHSEESENKKVKLISFIFKKQSLINKFIKM